ncbi:MAG: glutathione S-transferase [Polynucleobacter sp. 35-46-207]|jgi:glutathione S-transferase|nr:MAG: glutathione S-transferase [Polynucleobacter sp. 35-46-207]OZB37877.1 MAG: glutathione S-transferase [Polynucleobacter sp. 39-45-136]
MLPILYSYRRCPYAMRARMALKYAGIELEHREIELRNKPQSMLAISPKGTVPVFITNDLVLEQSLDIMRWALTRSDPDGWGAVDEQAAQIWIDHNDGPFKVLLDQYKYPNRYPECKPDEVLQSAMNEMLVPMEEALKVQQHLLADRMTYVDIAIFPFIRQFAMVDPQRFASLPLQSVQQWLDKHLQSELFLSVMQKYPNWHD